MMRLGCIRDKFDARDYLMRAYLPVVKLPKKVDHTQKMSPVREQGEEGTCVGFAVASGMKEYQEFLDYEKLVELSPRFLYTEARLIDGMPGLEGTTIRASMQALKKKGVCQERFWPYSVHQKDKPKAGAKANAKKFRIITYARILNLNELRMNLSSIGPVVLGIEVFKGMFKTKTGIVPLPKKNEASLGGHAICAVGYTDEKKLIKFKNSWSTKWGEKGFGYLPYGYIQRYMMDAWSSVDIEDPNPLTLASVISYRENLDNS
ncbi:MAG: C1 family peptidase [Candidatus Omnitrophota bacterium]|nr:C1 family peptidase [Candidatus Omnitrophota bacterium]